MKDTYVRTYVLQERYIWVPLFSLRVGKSCAGDASDRDKAGPDRLRHRRKRLCHGRAVGERAVSA